MMTTRILALGALVATLCVPCSSFAESILGMEFSGGVAGGASGTVLGWTFSASEDLTVAALGLWDYESDGFYQDHHVGLYDSDETLLGSVVIQLDEKSSPQGSTMGGASSASRISPPRSA